MDYIWISFLPWDQWMVPLGCGRIDVQLKKSCTVFILFKWLFWTYSWWQAILSSLTIIHFCLRTIWLYATALGMMTHLLVCRSALLHSSAVTARCSLFGYTLIPSPHIPPWVFTHWHKNILCMTYTILYPTNSWRSSTCETRWDYYAFTTYQVLICVFGLCIMLMLVMGRCMGLLTVFVIRFIQYVFIYF